jgi:hypothetical protein
MARKQTKKKIKLSGPPTKHRQGYRGRIASNAYVINRNDILKFENGIATLFRDGVPIYKKALKEAELSKFIRMIGDYGDTVLNKYFEPIPESTQSPPPAPSEDTKEPPKP